MTEEIKRIVDTYPDHTDILETEDGFRFDTEEKHIFISLSGEVKERWIRGKKPKTKETASLHEEIRNKVKASVPIKKEESDDHTFPVKKVSVDFFPGEKVKTIYDPDTVYTVREVRLFETGAEMVIETDGFDIYTVTPKDCIPA